ncbi:disease resistance RPP13-like protein 4 [Capsicum galapagoense]
MGDPITSAVASLIVTDLSKQVNMQAQYAIQFESQFAEMKRELNHMRAYLTEANKMKGKNKSVKSTLSDLDELIYEADNVITDCQIREVYLRMKGNPSCLFPSLREISFRYNTGRKLTELNKEIAKMHQKLRTFVGPIAEQSRSDGRRSRPTRWTSHIFDQSEIVGLSEDTSKIKDWILCHSESLHRVGIVGMGGLGKTTIAQKIYHDRQVNVRFQKKVWVSISQTYDELSIMKGILKQLSADDSGTDKGDLLNRIREALSCKSYLIVMDDVRSIDDGWWDWISRGLPKFIEHNSCIIITSRNEDVVKRMGATESRIHRPRLLDDEESWSLFCKVALLSTKGKCNTQLEEVGREIVRKCHGLPLAIKTTGGMLSSKSHSLGEWKRICENFREKLVSDCESNISVMASLQLSYDELPSRLKQCILCFSIYPDDHEIEAEQLVRWWVGEGFVRADGTETATDVAFNHLSELVSRCLVEAVQRRNFDGRVYSCKMHDMVRDMIILMAEDEKFCSFNRGRHIATVDSRHLGVMKETTFQSLAGNSKLRALLLTTTNFIGFNRKIALAEIKTLRVLDLSFVRLDNICLLDLWQWITSLKRLAYLNLRDVANLEEIPDSVRKLWGLQILVLRECKELKSLPASITTLPRLAILDVGGCPSFSCLPQGLSGLSNLEELYGFKIPSPATTEACRLSEVVALNQLRVLQLDITEESTIEEKELAALKQLRLLRVLSINAWDCENKHIIRKLDNLSPPTHVEELYLRHFLGETTPAWINPISLPQLQYLCIEDSRVLSHMNENFWGDNEGSWNVEGLCLKFLPRLGETWETFETAMPALKYLEISHCNSLKNFPCNIEGLGYWTKPEEKVENKEEQDVISCHGGNEGEVEEVH